MLLFGRMTAAAAAAAGDSVFISDLSQQQSSSSSNAEDAQTSQAVHSLMFLFHLSIQCFSIIGLPTGTVPLLGTQVGG